MEGKLKRVHIIGIKAFLETDEGYERVELASNKETSKWLDSIFKVAEKEPPKRDIDWRSIPGVLL